ncbi:MAG TPA: CobD/CbiB family protein [Burkholderiales bacterium]|nr:CobD/CbiB family protein [Burkholderiales bacterium]
MAFFTLLAALMLESTWHAPRADQLIILFDRYADRLAHDLNAGKAVHGVVGWLAAVCPWVFLSLVVFYALDVVSPVLSWIWTVALLYASLGFRSVVHGVRTIFESLRAGQLDEARASLSRWSGGTDLSSYAEPEIAKTTIETALTRVHRQVFGVIFWFVVLPGPAGAVLYRLAEETERLWAHGREEESRAFGTFAAKAFHTLDWLPVRLSAIGFAVAGNFEDAISTWRMQAQSWIDRTQGIVLASGAGALGVRLGGPLPASNGIDFRPELGDGGIADADYLQSTLSLLWRALIVWLVLLLLLTLARWVGY